MKLHKGNKNKLAAETEKLTTLTFKINWRFVFLLKKCHSQQQSYEAGHD